MWLVPQECLAAEREKKERDMREEENKKDVSAAFLMWNVCVCVRV